MKINIRAPEYQVVKWIADTYRSGAVPVLCLCCEAWINTLPKDCPVIPVERDPVAVFLRHSRGRRHLPVQPVPARREYYQVESGIRGRRIREAAYFLSIPATQAWRLAIKEGVRALAARGLDTPPWIETEEAIPVNSVIAAATAEQVLWLAEVLEAGWAPAEEIRAQLEARAREIV